MGSSPQKEGKACLERYNLEQEKPDLSSTAVFIWTFLFSHLGCPVIAPLSQPLSSRADTEACSWDSAGQGSAGCRPLAWPAALHRREPGWHSTAKPPAHKRPKSLLTARPDLLQSKHWKSKPLCTLSTSSPRCQCLNLVATFRSINLFQRRWKWQLKKLAKLCRVFLRTVLGT